MPQTETSIDRAALVALLDNYSAAALTRIVLTLGLAGRTERVDRAVQLARVSEHIGSEGHLARLSTSLERAQWRALANQALLHGTVTVRALSLRIGSAGDKGTPAYGLLQALFDSGAIIITVAGELQGRLNPTASQLQYGSLSYYRVMSLPAIVEAAERRAESALKAPFPEITPDRVLDADSSALRRDAYLVLQAASKNLRLTNKLVPYKADMRAITAGPPKSAGKGTAKSSQKAAPAVQNVLLERAWFVAAALLAGGALKTDVEREPRLLPTDQAQPYLTGSPLDQVRLLYAGWLRSRFSELARVPTLEFEYGVNTDHCWTEPPENMVTRGDIPNVDQLAAARATIVEVLRRANAQIGDTWVPIAGFRQLMHEERPDFLVPDHAVEDRRYGYGPSFYDGIHVRSSVERRAVPVARRADGWDDVEGAYLEQVIREPLCWLGLVDLGLDKAGAPVAFRLSPLGRHLMLGDRLEAQATQAADAPALVVQPSFELVVLDAMNNLALLATLDGIADRQSVERAATYRLTRESVVRGLESGLTSSAIVKTLETAARAPLPQNVAYSIGDWSRLYDRVHLRKAVTVLLADSPDQIRSWTHNDQVSSQLDHVLSPTVAMVKQDAHLRVASFLERRGMAPRVVDYREPTRDIAKLASTTLIEVPAKHDEPYLRYRLSQLADERPAAKHTLRFELTRESVHRAGTLGRSADEVQTYLNGLIGAPVPIETRLRIDGWGGAYPSLRYQSVVFFEIPSGGPSWQDLSVEPIVADAIIGVIGKTMALVNPAKLDALRQALSGIGIEQAEGLAPRTPGKMSPISPSKPERDGRRSEPAASERGLGADLSGMTAVLAGVVVENAYLAKKYIDLKIRDRNGNIGLMTLQPTALYEMKGKHIFDGLCLDCGKTHTVALEDVVDVANPSGPGRRPRAPTHG
jgi:hypothetical protein